MNTTFNNFSKDTEPSYVDLGLPSGTLWATKNIKDTSGNDLYFAWGETKGYTSDDIDSNVRSFNVSEYTGNSASLISDNLIGKCDAAHIYMRGYWRTPINKDFTELIKNTYKTLVTRGMKGCYVYCTNKELGEYLKSR